MSSKYKIQFSSSAKKILKRLDKTTANRIVNEIEILAKDPHSHPRTKKMKGYEENIYRLRVGQYRIIYELINEKFYILIIRIGSRGDIYK